MEKFKLKEGKEYIALKDLIKILGWVATGGEAMSRIDNREIKGMRQSKHNEGRKSEEVML
ncbi:MAG: RNA-binding S4 domain-containing protein [Chryseolinea sp.]